MREKFQAEFIKKLNTQGLFVEGRISQRALGVLHWNMVKGDNFRDAAKKALENKTTKNMGRKTRIEIEQLYYGEDLENVRLRGRLSYVQNKIEKIQSKIIKLEMDIISERKILEYKKSTALAISSMITK